METNIVDERMGFVTDFASGHWSMTELCERVLTCRLSSDQSFLENGTLDGLAETAALDLSSAGRRGAQSGVLQVRVGEVRHRAPLPVR